MTDYATRLQPGEALLLAQSIRSFGGRMAVNPIWAVHPIGAEYAPTNIRHPVFQLLADQGVQMLEYELPPGAAAFPFAAKVYAAAAAEDQAASRGKDLLVWMDVDSLVIQEPSVLELPPGTKLGCRPVDHTLIGSPYEEPVDAFWGQIYEQCQVPGDRPWPVMTSVDRQRLRPYYNAGFLVVRPELGLLRQWAARFSTMINRPAFQPWYASHPTYRIFMHQAVLAGVIVAELQAPEIYELPWRVNYPLHMHGQYPAEERPSRMNDLITARYDTLFDTEDWVHVIGLDEPLRSWLSDQLAIRASFAPS